MSVRNSSLMGLPVMHVFLKVSFNLKLFFNEKKNWHKLLTERPFLKDHFPGYEKYIWLDADTEVLDSQGIKNLIDATEEKDLAISTETNESYVFKNTKFGIKTVSYTHLTLPTKA